MTSSRTDSHDLLLGMDVGSTSVKLVALDPQTHVTLFSDYARHNASPAATAARMLARFSTAHPDARTPMAICGSAGQHMAGILAQSYIQEVVAATMATDRFFPETRVVIELGGQDAKVVFLSPESGADMRMNGSCAGGTGAFLDQVAVLLGIGIEAFETLASQGEQVYPISGRCGVFARTDIQPLLSEGAPRADIALSALHAVAKQTLGGLAQGRTLHPPLLFLGGPCRFIPSLPRVFAERLGCGAGDVVCPEQADVMVAAGAALALQELFPDAIALDVCRAIEHLTSMHAGARRAPSVSTAVPRLGWPGLAEETHRDRGFFESREERCEFDRRHAAPAWSPASFPRGTTVPVFIGIDAGSTTSKFAVLDERGDVIDRFYASNSEEPIDVIRDGLAAMFARRAEQGVALEVLGSAATGYGERLFAAAFQTDVSAVETVAHAEAARRVAPDVSFVLDVGGQDMKAIFLQQGIITGITLNEACSAGCGSFLETYAAGLGVPLGELADMAFSSPNPSALGSRCTVFMNSAIVTEQKLGRTAPDILAGLCRSVVENVFSKVLRLANLDVLGSHVVVQGGTFKNDAVLRAFEQFAGRHATRPPHPGEMGAIGAALLARKHYLRSGSASTFLSPDALRQVHVTRHTGIDCERCSNRCRRMLLDFGSGRCVLTGNRCERGGDVGEALARVTTAGKHKPPVSEGRARDLMRELPGLLTRDWRGGDAHADGRDGQRVGIPRVLGMWAWLPFWSALIRELGMEVVVSPLSNERSFEQGLASVPSDTACLPAKLVHGHIRDLAAAGVDRILLPEVIAWPRENDAIHGTAVCAMLQGYATVIRATDDPEARFGIPLDRPVLHGHTRSLLGSQLEVWINRTFGHDNQQAQSAIQRAWEADAAYRDHMQARGRDVVESLKDDEFAVILAGRPYHADPFTSHRVSRLFASRGVSVLPMEAVPGIYEVNLDAVRVDCLNSFHARLLSAAILASRGPRLEMAQLTSFGCGHDAILSDETARVLREAGGKELLVLKLDEGDVAGPLAIRVRSFVASTRARRDAGPSRATATPLSVPFEKTFTREDRRERTVLVPNLSESFAILAGAIFDTHGYKLKLLPPADAQAVGLGKRYVHNDICFPAQVNIGEALRYLTDHHGNGEDFALALAKNCENCRAGQYAVLARKALDEAGFGDVPLLSTGSDSKNMHPGFRMKVAFRIAMVWGIFLIDALERMLRATRPYEAHSGETQAVFDRYLHAICEAVPRSRKRALERFATAVEAFNAIDADRTERRPRVGIVGEILIKYHPTAAAGIQAYLEAHGMEIVQPDMIDFFRRDDLIRREKIQRGFEPHPWVASLIGSVSEHVYRRAWERVAPIARRFRYYEKHGDCYELAERVSHIFDRSYKVGEGWMMAAEILDMADHGVESFVILQPFGCIPNHISGRGVLKAIQREIPHGRFVPLDVDPDTSFANVENRLQMLVWNARRSVLMRRPRRSKKTAR